MARSIAAGSPDVSPWGDSIWKNKPIGCVVHYTAGGDMKGSVDWLANPAFQAKASAHVIVGRGKEDWVNQSVKPDGLLAQLPASVVQLRLPTQRAWHSTWANESYIGIELASMGEVRQKNGKLFGPNNDWSEPLKDKAGLIYSAQRSWENYTIAQMQTAVRVMQYYAAMHGPFSQCNIIGHEHAQGIKTPERLGCDKRDPGVWLDMTSIRECVSGTKDCSLINLQPRMSSGGAVFDVASGSGAQIDAQAAEQMKQLGYYIKAPLGLRFFDSKTPENIESLKMFQRMMGLIADGVAGPRTTSALAWRMNDRWRSAPSA